MKKVLPLATALILTFVFFSFIIEISGRTSEKEEIQKLIETAKTPEDHMKITEYYEKEASKMEVHAYSHASMAESYMNRGKPLPGLAKHCENLAKEYKEAAKEYKAMAAEHKKIAEEMQRH